MPDVDFNKYAKTYEKDLNQALSISGEEKNYFALGRLKWLAKFLNSIEFKAGSVLDFGCGTGSATPFIFETLTPRIVFGVDISADSLRVAEQSFGNLGATFDLIDTPRYGFYDLAFSNGVFHHIRPNERQKSLAYVYESLRTGGLFALFENNPWNPATNYVMSRCSFDHDAITLSPMEAKRRMIAAGFRVVTTRYLFIFPASLKFFRFLESPLSPCPFGTQYVVLGEK